MISLNDSLKIFSGSAHPALTNKICKYLGLPAGRVKISAFPDGETFVKLEDDVRGRDCFIVQPTCKPVNDNLMELLIFVDCMRRASAQRITVVLPYFGYARQDRKDEGRVPISAKLVANLITEAGANRVLTIDLHAAQIQGFFDIPVDHLLAEPVLSAYFGKMQLEDKVLVSPDVGNVKTAKRFANRLGGDLAIIDKRRLSGSDIVVQNIVGNVEGKTVLMFDDMITTAGTICEAAKVVKDRGAKAVFAGATHGVFAPGAVERLKQAPIDQIVVTDTIPYAEDLQRQLPNLRVLTVSELLGEAIKRIHRNESISVLFSQD